MKLTLGILVGAGTVILIWRFWRPAVGWALSHGDGDVRVAS